MAKKVEVGAFAYAGFARGVISRRETLQNSLAELEARIAAAQQDVAEAFQDLKRHEIALAAKQRRQREEADRRQQVELDEVSIEMHRRRTA